MPNQDLSAQSIVAQCRFGHLNDPQTSCRDHVWKIANFLEIQSIVGKDRAETLLRSYVMHLGRAANAVRAGGFDVTQMRETVHDLKSMSGQLGFEALQSFCSDALAAGSAVPIGELVEPLLTLIKAATDAAQSFCYRPRPKGPTTEFSQLA